MKRIFILSAALCLFAGTAAFAQSAEAFPSYVDVTGYAEKEVAPDVFYLKIVLRESDSKGKKTIDQQQKDMISALKGIGIDTEKSLVRTSLSSSYYKKKSNLAQAVFQLKVSDAALLYKVWNKMDALGISEVDFTKAEYSKMEEVKEEVRNNAVKDARRQAESMAAAINQTIGKCFYLYGGHTSSPVLYAQPRLAAKSMILNDAAQAAPEEESVEFDNIKVSASVSAKFVLE